MARDRTAPQGPIPVGELIQRLIRRDTAGQPSIKPTRKPAPFPPVVPQFGTVAAGRFEMHGPGSPPYDLGRPSYFVKILTAEGPKTIWGSDLKRAIQESETNPKLHTLIGVQRVGYQMIKVPKKNGAPGETQQLKRTRWRVERVEFFAERATEAKRTRTAMMLQKDRDGRPPPSIPAAVVKRLQEAKAFSDLHIHNERDRELFLESVKNRLMQSLFLPPNTRIPEKDHEAPSR